MKRIEVFFPSDRLREVQDAIKNAGASGFFLSSGKGQGKGERPKVGGARGTGTRIAEYNLIESIITVVDDPISEKVVNAILDAASTGNKGDGKIFITNIDAAVDIGSKSRGAQRRFRSLRGKRTS